MTCSSKFNTEINAIEIVYSGRITIDDIRETFKKAVELSYQHRVTAGLIDCLYLHPIRSIINIYDLAAEIEKIPNIRMLKGGIILPVSQQSAEELKFFETTARNRGLNVRVFPDRDDTIKWLTSHWKILVTHRTKSP